MALNASDVFEPRTRTGNAHFACQDSGLFQNFKLTVATSVKIHKNTNFLVWRQVKEKTPHFRSPSVAYSVACLSFLRSFPLPLIKRFSNDCPKNQCQSNYSDPITTGVNCMTNQPEFVEITCNLLNDTYMWFFFQFCFSLVGKMARDFKENLRSVASAVV